MQISFLPSLDKHELESPAAQITHLFLVSYFLPCTHWGLGHLAYCLLVTSPTITLVPSQNVCLRNPCDALALFSFGLISEGIHLLSTKQCTPMGAPLPSGVSPPKGHNPAFVCILQLLCLSPILPIHTTNSSSGRAAPLCGLLLASHPSP